MKKSLFAIAAATAFVGAAQAQSSVTVYGILDVGYINQSQQQRGNTQAGNNTLGTGAYAAGNTGTTNGTSSAFASSAESSSRLGFRGTEDLGGGNRAFFTFETGLSPNGANMSAVNNRQSFLGLGTKGIGAASIGMQYTPMHEGVAATDPGQANNMPGNLVYVADNSGTNNPGSFAATTPGTQSCPTFAAAAANGAATVNTSCPGGPGLNNAPYIVRSTNMLKFVSDPFAGVVAKAFYVQNGNTTSTLTNNTTTTTGGYTNNYGFGAGLDWTFNKLFVNASYNSFKGNQAAMVTAATNGAAVSTVPVLATTTWDSTRLSNAQTDMYAGATYNFGILTAYAQYISRKVTASYDSSEYVKRTAQQIGVRSFVTPKIETWASGGIGKLTNSYAVQAAGAAQATQAVGQNLTAFQLGTNYWLSKRTNIYGIYGISKVANGVFPTTANGNTAAINAVSSQISAYAIGVRHTF